MATFSDDNVATWTWNNRHLLDTDTTTFGDLAEVDKDFKSPAYATSETEAMFLPVGYLGLTFWPADPRPRSVPWWRLRAVLVSRFGTGIPMNAGTLTVENSARPACTSMQSTGMAPTREHLGTDLELRVQQWLPSVTLATPQWVPRNGSQREMASLEGSPPAGAGFGYAI